MVGGVILYRLLDLTPEGVLLSVQNPNLIQEEAVACVQDVLTDCCVWVFPICVFFETNTVGRFTDILVAAFPHSI